MADQGLNSNTRNLTGAWCSLRMYNTLVERCFRDCVDSFRRKDLDSTEEKVCHLPTAVCAKAGWQASVHAFTPPRNQLEADKWLVTGTVYLQVL